MRPGGSWPSSASHSPSRIEAGAGRAYLRSMTDDKTEPTPPAEPATIAEAQPTEPEIGGPKEARPTRYGDWTVKGRCIDF